MADRAPRVSCPAVDLRRPGLVWPVRQDPRGLTGPTRGETRGQAWTSPYRGFFLPTGLDPALAVAQAIVSAAALLPEGGAVTGWAALRWQGVRHLGGSSNGVALPVPLAVPPDRVTPRPGILVARDTYLREGLQEVDGLMLSSAAASVAFEVCHARSMTDAVAMIDRAAAADLVSLDELASLTARLAGVRQVRRLGRAIALADENCWSPMETEMRGWWRSIGLTDVVCNRPVFDEDGRFVGTPDLLHLPTGTVGEYDGALHLVSSQRGKDVRREGAFRRLGMEYVEMVTADLPDPRDFLRRTRDAVERSRTLERRWTIEPPPGWVETHTVERRRGLDAWERDRFLRWQAG
ncbi:hypothetical protein [Nocardioides montaniterrae]